MSNKFYCLFVLLLLGTVTSSLAQGFFILHRYEEEPCANGNNCAGAGCTGWEQTQNIIVGNTTHNLQFLDSGAVRYYNQTFSGITYELICRGNSIETQDVRTSSLPGDIGPISLFSPSDGLYYYTNLIHRDDAKTTIQYISGQGENEEPDDLNGALCFGDRIVISPGVALAANFEDSSPYHMEINVDEGTDWEAVNLLMNNSVPQEVYTMEEIYGYVNQAFPGEYPTIQDLYDINIRVRIYRGWLSGVKQYLASESFKWVLQEKPPGFTINSLSPDCDTRNGRIEIVDWNGADEAYQLFLNPISGGTWDGIANNDEPTAKEFLTGTDLIIPDDLVVGDQPNEEHSFFGTYQIEIRPRNYSAIEECTYYDTVFVDAPSVQVAVNSITPNVSEFCVAGDTTIINLEVNKYSDGDSTLEWEWWPPGASRFLLFSTGNLDESIDISSPGTYRFRFSILDRFGCSAQNTTSITAYEQPPALTALTLSQYEACGGGQDTVRLTVSPANADSITYWPGTLTESWMRKRNGNAYTSLDASGLSHDFPATFGDYQFRYVLQNELCPADTVISDTLVVQGTVDGFSAGAYTDATGNTPVSGVVCGDEAYLIGGPSYGRWSILSNPGNGVRLVGSTHQVQAIATKNGTYTFVFKAQRSSLPLGDCHKQDTVSVTFNLPDAVTAPSISGLAAGVHCDFPSNTLRISSSGLTASYPLDSVVWVRIDHNGQVDALGEGGQVTLDPATFSDYHQNYDFVYTLRHSVCPSRVLTNTLSASFDPPLPAYTATISSDMPNPSCEEYTATLQLNSSYPIADLVNISGLTANWSVSPSGAALSTVNDSTLDVELPFGKHGRYTASWVVSKGACTKTINRYVYYNGPIAAPDIEMIPPTVCGDSAFVGVNTPLNRTGIGVELVASTATSATPSVSSYFQNIDGVPTYYLFGVTETGDYTATMRYLDNRSYSSCPDSDSVTATVTRIDVDLNDADASATATTSCTNQFLLQGNASGISEGYSQWSVLSKPVGGQVVLQDEASTATMASVNKPGAYTFTYALGVSGDNNCKPTLDTVTVTYYTFSADVSVTPTSCAIGSTVGTNDGALQLNTISIAPSTGGGMSFSWPHDPGNTDSLLAGLEAGVGYEIVLYDSVTGCRDTLVKEVTLLGEFSLDASPLAQFNGEAISCPGESDGVIEAYVSGGTADYTFEIFDDQHTRLDSITVSYAGMEFENLLAGDYFVSLEDANGCITWDSVTMFDPALALNQWEALDRNGYGITCFGDNDGVLQLDFTGGNASPNGYTYALVATDSLGAGTDTLNKYASRTGSNDQLTGLSAGYYRIGVQDSDGCNFAIDSVFSVTEPTAVSLVYTAQSDFSGYGLQCHGDASGALSLQAVGGRSSYTYTLFNATTLLEASSGTEQDTVGFDTLAASNNYRVVVQDANGCGVEQSFSLTQPSPLIPALSKTTFYNGADLLCFGDTTGVLEASASGGVANYHYRLRNKDGLVDDQTGQSGSYAFSNLSSGWYWIAVFDANNCQVESDSVVLVDPAAMEVSIQADPNLQNRRGGYDISCHGLADGKILLSPGGGTLSDGAYQFTWTGPSGYNAAVEDPTGLAAGTYQVTVQDDNACTTDASITLYEPAALSLTDSATTRPSCANTQDGSLQLSAAGGVFLPGNAYEFSYGLGGTTLGKVQSANPAIFQNQDGHYWIQVKDNNGCTDRGFATIVDDLPLTLSITDSSGVSCYNGNDGRISLLAQNGTAGYVFSLWNPEGTQADTLSQSAGSTATFSNLEGNTLSSTYLQVADAKGCLDSVHLALPQPSPISMALTESILPNCYQETNGSLTMAASGGVGGYLFSRDSVDFSAGLGIEFTATNLAGGVFYDFWVRDANFSPDQNACTIKETFRLAERPQIQLAGTVSSVSCAGGSDGGIVIEGVTGGAGDPNQWDYAWYRVQDGAPIFIGSPVTNLSAGEYRVVATDSLACIDTAIFDVFEPSAITVETEVLEISCGLVGLAGKLRVVAQGGPSKDYEFSVDGGRWNRATSGVYLFEGLAVGSHTIVARNVGTNCAVSVAVEIAKPALSFTIDQQVAPTCAGDATGWLSILPDYAGSYEYSIDSGRTFQDSTRFFTNLSAGTYYVTLREVDKPCYQYVEAVTLADPDPFSITAFEDYPASCGGANGAVGVTIVGVGPFEPATWTDMAGAPVNPVGLASGWYRVAITGPSGCVLADTAEVTVGPEPQWQLDLVQAPGCNEAGGTLAISELVPGITPYSIVWDHTASTADTLTGLSGGSYHATVTDARGCTDTLSMVLSDTAIVTFTTQITDAACGQASGAIEVEARGGAGSYTYHWPAGVSASGNLASNLAPGGYVITVSDLSGCSATDVAWINATDGVSDVSITVSPEACDQQNGALAVTAVLGGTAPYAFRWTNTQGDTVGTGSSLSNLAAGKYILIVEDASGCAAGFSAEVGVDATTISTLAQALIAPDTCAQGNGSIVLAFSEDLGPYTAHWTDDQDTPLPGNGLVQTGLPSGAYTVSITNAKGCVLDTVLRVEKLLAPAVSLTTSLLATCGEVGTAEAMAVGGVSPYQFQWSSGEVGGEAVALASGSAWVAVTDAAGCASDTLHFNMNGGSDVALALDATTPVSCAGDLGTATVKTLGGTAPYTLAWADGQSGVEAVGLVPGAHQVSVTDALGCTDSLAVEITAQTIGVHLRLAAPPTCAGGADGQLVIATSGANAPDFTWNNGLTGSAISGLESGAYAVSVLDANGCALDTVFTLAAAPGITTQLTDRQNPTCAGSANGRLTVKASGGNGGFAYAWNTGAQQSRLNGVEAGAYSVVVTDARGCTDTLETSLLDPQPLAITEVLAQTPTCAGDQNGRFDLRIAHGSAPYLLQWSQGGSQVRNGQLKAGSYQVHVQDQWGCTTDTTLVLADPPQLRLDSIVLTDPACATTTDGTALAYAQGGVGTLEYRWSNGLQGSAISGLGTQSLSLRVVDEQGCVVKRSALNLQAPDPMYIAVHEMQAISCFEGNDGALTVAVSGGAGPYAYAWSNDDSTQTVYDLASGNYTVMVSDAKGCRDTAQYTLQDPAALRVSEVTYLPSCVGEADGAARISLTTDALPYLVQWDDGLVGDYRADLAEGTYQYTVVDAKGCVLTDTVRLREPEAITVNITSQAPGCAGGQDGSIFVQAAGGTGSYVYTWSDGVRGPQRGGLDAGTYRVTIRDQNQCTVSQSETINEFPPLVLAITQQQSPRCFADSTGRIEIDVTGGDGVYTISWSDFAQEVNRINVPAGNYTAYVEDGQNCFVQQPVALTEPSAIQPSATYATPPDCPGDCNGTLQVALSGGTGAKLITYDNGQSGNFLTGLCADTLGYTATDALGCTYYGEAMVADPEPVVVRWDSVSSESCVGGDGYIRVGGRSGYSYLWSDGATGRIRSGLTAGTYVVSVMNDMGCMATDSITLGPAVPLRMDSVAMTNPLCRGENTGAIAVFPTGGTGNYQYLWSTGARDAAITNLATGFYFLEVTSGSCVVQDTLFLGQPDPLAVVVDTARSPACFGDCNGMIAVHGLGGVGPYTYSLGNDLMGDTISGLCPGDYVLTLEDVNGCKIRESVSLPGPEDSLSVAVMYQRDPLCTQEATGIIVAEATGGTEPYAIAWNYGGSGERVSSLFAGDYVATVTDAAGCTDVVETTLVDPAPLTIDQLPDSLEVCVGSSIGVDAGLWASYTWTGPDNFTYDGRLATVQAEGAYRLTVTNVTGCMAEDAFYLSERAETLAVDLIGPSVAHVGDTVAMVDVSYPIPDSVHWSLPWQHMIQVENESFYQKMVFVDTGNFFLQMDAYRLGCQSSAVLPITILPAAPRTEAEQAGMGHQATAKSMAVSVYPNPTQGRFTVTVDLPAAAPVRVEVLDMVRYASVWEVATEGGVSYRIPVTLPTSAREGVYLVRIMTPSHTRTIPVVLGE